MEEASRLYKKYREMFPDKSAFSCWANMCINEYLDGEVVYTLVRDSWEEFQSWNRKKIGRKRFKRRGK